MSSINTKISVEDVISTFTEIIKSRQPLRFEESENKQSPPIFPFSIPKDVNLQIELPKNSNFQSMSEITKYLSKNVLTYLNQSSLSPNYYGFVTGGVTPAALLGDFLASIYDQNVAVHLPAETIATKIEVQALNLLLQLFHLPLTEWGIGNTDDHHPGNGGGTFTTGATASNFLGLALGREFVLSKAVKRRIGNEDVSCGKVGIYEIMKLASIERIQVLSSLPHSSIGKVASMVGIGRANVISIAKEHSPWELDLDKLVHEVRKDHVASILVISAGEVNTGRFATDSADLMKKIRDICDEHDVWIHVDGAFGLFGRVLYDDDPVTSEQYHDIINGVQGLELADSITGDAHKLLNVPYDCGFFFTRHKLLSERVFNNGNAAYLSSAAEEDGIQSPLNIGIENSRRFRALPVYATLIAYGREGYVDILRNQIGVARSVTLSILRDERFEILPKYENEDELLRRTFMIVLFRAKDPSLNEQLVREINATREIYVSGTIWDGKPAARIAVSNWRADPARDCPLIMDVLNHVCEVMKRESATSGVK